MFCTHCGMEQPTERGEIYVCIVMSANDRKFIKDPQSFKQLFDVKAANARLALWYTHEKNPV